MLPMVPSSTRPAATILIVEDDVLTRICGAGMFEDAGFSVIEAGDSDEALGLLAGGSKVQLLFTDVNLPGEIDGLALAREVHARWPFIGIIVASGHSQPQFHELPDGARFHRKPYSVDSVVRHARELMAG